MECRRKDVNNSYLATLAALGLIAGLTAVPEIGNFFARVDAQEALIADLQKNLGARAPGAWDPDRCRRPNVII